MSKRIVFEGSARNVYWSEHKEKKYASCSILRQTYLRMLREITFSEIDFLWNVLNHFWRINKALESAFVGIVNIIKPKWKQNRKFSSHLSNHIIWEKADSWRWLSEWKRSFLVIWKHINMRIYCLSALPHVTCVIFLFFEFIFYLSIWCQLSLSQILLLGRSNSYFWRKLNFFKTSALQKHRIRDHHSV